MDYTILAAELELPAYAGLTDQQAADALNTQNFAIRQRVLIADLQAEALRNGAYIAIDTAATATDTPAQLRAVCRAVLALVNARFESINLDDPSAQQMFGVLVQAGVLSPQQAAEIDILATVMVISRAQQLGIGTVTVADVEHSRIYPQMEALRVRAANAYNLVVAALDAATSVPEWTDLVDVFEAE